MRWIDKQTQGKVAYKFGDRIMPYSRVEIPPEVIISIINQ